MKTGLLKARSLFVLTSAAGLAAACPQPAGGQQHVVPPEVQADTFAKVFPFDRRLGDLSELQVLVLRPQPPGPWGPALDELERAFNAHGLPTRQVAAEELPDALSPTTVVYLVPESATAGALAAIAAAGALSISGLQAMAEAEQVSVALDARDGRPEVVINLARLGQERHEFSAQLLRVARVIRQATGGETRPPRLVHITEPQYTPMATRMRVQGEVVVRARVSETGQVTQVELVEGISQNVGLNEAAVAALRSATFEPALRDGQPVAEWFTRTFRFAL
jgi:TonB family protein